MKFEQAGALALILGALGGIAVMALHPAGVSVHDGATVHGLDLNLIVHALAIGLAPILTFGFVAVTRSLGFDRPMPVLALVFYAFGAIAVVLAASMSGLVAPHLIEAYKGASGTEKDMIHQLLHLEFGLNQAFAKVHVAMFSAAILLFALAWSGQGMFGAVIRLVGVLVGVGILAWLGSGTLTLNVHGMGAVVLVQSIWTVLAAIGLLGRKAD